MGKEAATTTQKRAAHVVLLASPGTGHVLPVAELARRIVAPHGDGAEFTATLVTYTNFSSADLYSTLASLPPSVSTAVLPEVPLGDLPADARVETRIFTVVKRALPRLRDLLRSLVESPSGVAAFVADLLSPWALQVAVELGVPRYLFCTTNLMALSCMLHVPELDRTTTCEFRDLPEPVHLPGCVPLRGADLLDPIQNRSDPAYRLMVELGENQRLAQGFIVNTFDAMEHETLVAFKELSDKGVYPPAYAVGPFVRPCSGSGGEADEHGCVRWLDPGRAPGRVRLVRVPWQRRHAVQQADSRAGRRSRGERAEVSDGGAVPERQGLQRELLWDGGTRRRPPEVPAGGVPREDQRRRALRAAVGAAGGDPEPPRRRRVPVSLRVELDA